MSQNNANDQPQWRHEPIIYPVIDGQMNAHSETDQAEARPIRARGQLQIDNSIPAQADASLFGALPNHASELGLPDQAFLVGLLYHLSNIHRLISLRHSHLYSHLIPSPTLLTPSRW